MYCNDFNESQCSIFNFTSSANTTHVTLSSIMLVFEHCILDRYARYFCTSDNQFGFKKEHGCSHAVYALRCVVDSYLAYGSTINLCALDLTKAFNKTRTHQEMR